MSANTEASDSVVFLLYWQVTHQAAVKSTNTLWPWAVSWSTRPGSQACQPCAPSANCPAACSLSCIFVRFGPLAHINSALTAIENVAITVRVWPFKVSAQTLNESSTSRPSRVPAPSMPLCWPSTHTSQATVANIGNAISCLKVTIHAPGRGSSLAMPGTTLAAR